MGLTLVRHGEQYDLTLHAETLGVGSAKLPAMPEEVTNARAKLDERADQVRELIETLDLLYAQFLAVRLSAKWVGELARIQGWLARTEQEHGQLDDGQWFCVPSRDSCQLLVLVDPTERTLFVGGTWCVEIRFGVPGSGDRRGELGRRFP